MKPCPICRENHEERGLSFDGKGVNGCGIYRTRLATFTSGCTDDTTAMLGPLFAAAPDLLQFAHDFLAMWTAAGPTDSPMEAQARAVIAKATGGQT